MDSQLLAFAVAAGVLTIVPGPDTLLVVRNVIRGGSRDGLSTTFGICSGLFVHATLSAFGLSVLLMHSATVFQFVKFAGACYLVWLGLQSLRSSLLQPPAKQPPLAQESFPTSPRHCFLEGALCNVLNPKTALFYLAFLPQFVRPEEPLLPQFFFMTGIHCLQGIVWLGTLSLLLQQARRIILQPGFRRCADGVCGALLIGFGARLGFER